MIRNPYKKLEKAMGYRFKRKAYLVAALTHRSFRFEEDDIHIDNQRLEFLGDAALGLVAAAHFYDTHPDRQEGELTKQRSRITSRQALAQIAESIGLGDFLRLGRGEIQSGGRTRPSNLADALEAILGAAYLDRRMKAVKKIFDTLFVPLAHATDVEPGADNPKGELQELCQRRWKRSPRYQIVQEEGPAHSRHFVAEVTLDGRSLGKGTGGNKRAAEAHAALHALTTYVESGDFGPSENGTTAPS